METLAHYADHALVGASLWAAARARGPRRFGWLVLCGAAFCRTAHFHHGQR